MSKMKSGLSEFLTEHQAVLVQLLGDVSAAESKSLVKAPLEMLAKLLAKRGLAPLSRELTGLLAAASAAEREEGDDDALQLMRETVPSLIPPPPPPPSRGPAARAPVPPPSAPPAAAPVRPEVPRHTARAKPPMRGGEMVL